MKHSNTVAKGPKKRTIIGPSAYEIEYLRQLRKELEVFLKGSSTVKQVFLGFQGEHYRAKVQVRS